MRKPKLTALAPAAALAALSLSAAPALAQPAGGGSPGMDRPMVAPGSPAPPVGLCERNYNLLNIMIEPGMHAIPVWVRPFTSQDDTAPEILALYNECAQRVAAAPPLVSWSASGPGLRPMGDMDTPLEGDPNRPDLEQQNRPAPR